jgi:hypothetical protein
VLLSQDNGQSYTNVSGNDLPGSARTLSEVEWIRL